MVANLLMLVYHAAWVFHLAVTTPLNNYGFPDDAGGLDLSITASWVLLSLEFFLKLSDLPRGDLKKNDTWIFLASLSISVCQIFVHSVRDSLEMFVVFVVLIMAKISADVTSRCHQYPDVARVLVYQGPVECAICRDAISTGTDPIAEGGSLPCFFSHQFHIGCLDEWVNASGKTACPICGKGFHC